MIKSKKPLYLDFRDAYALAQKLAVVRGSLLIAAVSGRSLAQAARRAGFTPLVADFFADADTQEAAHACRKLPGGIKRGFRWQTLYPALKALAERRSLPDPRFRLWVGLRGSPRVAER